MICICCPSTISHSTKLMAKFLIVGNPRSLAGYSTDRIFMVIYNDVMYCQDDSRAYLVSVVDLGQE